MRIVCRTCFGYAWIRPFIDGRHVVKPCPNNCDRDGMELTRAE